MKEGDSVVPTDESGVSGPSRDLKAAKRAYEGGDAEASRAAHEMTRLNAAPEVHGGAGSDYLKSIVFGGLDGIITTFAVIATVAGADLDVKIVILMGFANLVADGISMGFGDCLSSKAEQEFVENEYGREKWEFENYPEGERREMVELFVSKGMDEADATQIINLYSKYPELYVDLMMYEELGMMPPGNENPAVAGGVTFVSFLIFGSVPLWGYVIISAAGSDISTDLMFVIACILAGLTMFALGAFKARFTRQNWLLSGGGMLLNGAVAATAAYVLGLALESVLHVPKDGV